MKKYLAIFAAVFLAVFGALAATFFYDPTVLGLNDGSRDVATGLWVADYGVTTGVVYTKATNINPDAPETAHCMRTHDADGNWTQPDWTCPATPPTSIAACPSGQRPARDGLSCYTPTPAASCDPGQIPWSDRAGCYVPQN